MLRSINGLTRFKLKAIDQEVGYCKDFIFDDLTRTIRYMVADTRKWLPGGRKLLISPLLLGEPIWREKLLPVLLMREKLSQCPPLEELSLITRQWESLYSDCLGLPYYWHDAAPWAERDSSLADRADLESAIKEDGSEITPQLHSINELKGYCIEALDGNAGRLEDCLVDDQTWGIVALAINTTSKWVPGSRNVLMYLESTDRVSFTDNSIQVFLSTQDIFALPEYDPDEYRDPYYEAQNS